MRLVVLLASLTAGAAATDAPKRAPEDGDVVRKAMQDELARSMADLHLGDEPRPYYLAYTVSDVAQSTASATLGAVTAAHGYKGRVLRTDVRVGDASFDNTNFEGGPRVEPVPLEDDYGALRRELWLRTDEAYKSGIEMLARKRAAAAGQAADEDEQAVGDFAKEPPTRADAPFSAAVADPEALRDIVRQLSLVMVDYPQIYSSNVTATAALVRRRLATSEGTWVDDSKRTLRVDVVADTQADDGMKLRSFVPFTAFDPAGLPPLAEMEKAVRAMAKELVAMRTAPVASSGAGAVLFDGMAAAQLIKILIGDQLGGTPPPKTASAGSDDGSQQSVLASKLGMKVAAPLLSAVDDPLLERAPGAGRTPLFGAYKIDDEGVPAKRVPLIENGMLKALLMSRTPRKEIQRSNGHARAPRFAGPRAHVGTLVVSGGKTVGRAALMDALGNIAKGGGITTYVVRLLDDGLLPGGDVEDFSAMFSLFGGGHGPPPVRPLVVYRVANGKETLVRGLAFENLLPRSLKDVTAVGNDPYVYNYLDGGGGFSGIPTSIVAPPLLLSDVDIRRQTGKHRKPPVYPSPLVHIQNPERVPNLPR
jgi:predicted Zn-dependent protease